MLNIHGNKSLECFLKRDNNDVFKLSIGDCNDISIIYDLEEQKQFLIKTPIQIITQS